MTGTAPEVYAFAEPWGKPWRVVHENNVFELAAVVPASAHDAYREARDDDTELLLDWWEAFVREAYRTRRLTRASDGVRVGPADRANPTSNAIYERIGYRKVAEAAAIAFE